MNNFQTLEFDKIIAKTLEYTKSNYTREKFHNLKPCPDLSSLNTNLDMVKEALNLYAKYGDRVVDPQKIYMTRFRNAGLITALLIGIDKPWAKYVIGFNWDFKPYMFNCRPTISGINFEFSVLICLLYFLVLIIPAFIVFKHKDIKNI